MKTISASLKGAQHKSTHTRTFVASYVSIVADLTPLVGDVKGAVETVRGEDIFGQALGIFERTMGGAILLVQLKDSYAHIKGKAKNLSLFTRFDHNEP